MATIRLMVDDLDFIPEERVGDRHELIDGELIVTPVPIMKHQLVSRRLFRYLDRHTDDMNLGTILAAPTGIRLTQDTLVIPDLFFVAQGREVDPNAKSFDAVPDLVIEILSPGTRRRDHTFKRTLYSRFGVPEYWIVDPEAKSVLVLALNGDRYEAIPMSSDGAIRSRVLPELDLTLDQVFADLH